MTNGPIIQIAGILDRQEAFMLCDSGVTHVGIPLRLARHREDLSDQQARDIIASLPATALMGASRGRLPSSSWMVS